MRFLDRVAIVTGGGHGLGRTYAEKLALEGALVVVVDRDGAAAEAFAETVNQTTGEPRALAIACDVTDPEQVAAIRTRSVEQFGRIDLLINNVGSYPHQAFDEVTFEDWSKVLSTNLDSVFLCTKAVLPQMQEQRSGKIINMATNLVWIGLPYMVPYVTAKSAVIGFTRSLAKEMGAYNITVNAVAPGAVAPDPATLSEQGAAQLGAIIAYQSLKRGLAPQDVVGAVMFLASSESDFITGQVLTVDGGLTAH